MGDVTDRMAPRSKSTLGVGRGSTATSKSSEPPPTDLKTALKEVEPLKGSSNFTAKEVDEIMQSTAKLVGDTNVDWLKRLNMVRVHELEAVEVKH